MHLKQEQLVKNEISSLSFLKGYTYIKHYLLQKSKKNALLNFDNFNTVIMFCFFFECGLILHSSVKQKKNQD